jgi:hypothetical protein
MSITRYPKVGTTNRLYQKNQFGRTRKHTVIKCYACEREAMHRIRIEVNWFRSDDRVLYACDAHNKALRDEPELAASVVKDTAHG